MNLINVTLLLVHFLIMSNFYVCVFHVHAYVFYDVTFFHSVVRLLPFCKHVRLPCVFLNKLT